MQRVYDTAAPMVSQFPYFARLFFFFNDTATTEIYTLSLHDALPISFTGSGAIGRRLLEYSARSNLKRSEEHTSELQSPQNLVCRLLLEKKTKNKRATTAGRETDMSTRLEDVITRAPATRPLSCLHKDHSLLSVRFLVPSFFFLNDRAPPEISPLPLPDALRI